MPADAKRAMGKVVLAMSALTIFAASAWAAAGGLDHSFSGDGRQITSFANGAGFDQVLGVAIQSNGKVVVAGFSEQGGTTGTDFALARYNPNGSLDHSFSGDGRKTTAFGNGAGYDAATAVAIQSNGKVVVAGSSDQAGASGTDFALARYNPNGSLDHSFSGDGRKTTAFANGARSDSGAALAIEPNGKIVVAGSANEGVTTGYDFALARYNPNGSLDPGFSGDGREATDFANGGGTDQATGVAIQANGKVVVAGLSYQSATGNDFAVARYNRNGGLDHSFSAAGHKTTAFGNGTGDDRAYGMALQSNGRIVVAGYSYQGAATSFDFALARYNVNGSLDHSFSGDGRKTTDFVHDADAGYAIRIMANGKIVVAGSGYQAATTHADFALARYNASGSLDHSLSGDGRQTTAFDNGANGDVADALAIGPNGKVVLGGYSNQGATTGYDFAVARYLP